MKYLYNHGKANKTASDGIINKLENSVRGDVIKALILTYGLMLADIPIANGAENLNGTPKTSPDGVTVYEANVEPGQTYKSVYGIRDNTDSKNYAKITINKGSVSNTIYGCQAISGDNLVQGSYNKVTIINSTIGTDSTFGTVYGGYAYGRSNSAKVHDNTVEISDGNVSGFVYGGNADGSTISVVYNNVLLKNTIIGKTVYGGNAFNTGGWISMVGNTVTIENSTVNGSVYGGYANGSNTFSNKNKVIIKGNSTLIKDSVYGSYSLSSSSHADLNEVIIEGGTINKKIYGGVGYHAKGNTIVLKGGDLRNADLYGYSDGRKSHEGNTLEVWASNMQVRSAQNFENYYFIVPDGMANQADKYILRSSIPVILSGTNVGVAVQNGTVLYIGDKINLIDKTEGNPTWTSLVGKELKGGTLFTNYDFTLSTTTSDKTLVATTNSAAYEEPIQPPLLGGSPKPAGWADEKTKALAEGQAASVALLGEGNELAAGAALEDAKTAARAASEEGSNMATFATLGYGRSLYDTGSHANVHTTDFIVGLSKEYISSNGELTLGAFFENGRGNYSTHNDFETGSVGGNGKAKYYGGGLMLQLDSCKNKGLYIQAIGRIGRMKNQWNSGDFSEYVDYDTRHRYYGADFGLGYERKASENRSYKLYGKFLWTRQKGDDANIKGEQLCFDDINSVKARIGLKMDYKGYKTVKPFWGVAWEREFKGEANAKVNLYDINAPSLKGNTGLFEFGLKYKPVSKSDWHFNFAITGYVGARRGMDGQASFNFNF